MKIMLKCTKTILLENKNKKYAVQNEQKWANFNANSKTEILN